MNKFFIFFVLFLFLSSVSVFAVELPESLQKVEDYNLSQANYYLGAISFIVAFLAGLLAILSPCSIAIIPMYFSYGLKEKSTLHTTAFFCGFTLVFVLLGVLASFFGQSILLFQGDLDFLIFLAGLLLLFFGIMLVLGKVFSFLPVKVFKAQSVFGVFLLGVLFALGWSACTGPILSGVLLIAAVLGNYFTVALLMFFYALGNFVPFFLLSFTVDGFRLAEKSWIKGKILTFSFFGETFQTHTTSIVSGILLIGMGLLFLLSGNTGLFNAIIIGDIQMTETSLQNALLTTGWVSVVGAILLFFFVVGLFYFLLKGRRKG